MEGTALSKPNNHVDHGNVDAIPAGHDRAIAIEARRRDATYHLGRYLVKTRHSVNTTTSLIHGDMILDTPERHKYARQVAHDLLETDLTMLVGQLNQVLREKQITNKSIFRVLAISTIVFFSGTLTFWRNLRWAGQSMLGLMCLNASFGIFVTSKWTIMKCCRDHASDLLNDLQRGGIDDTSYKRLEAWHWKALLWCLSRP